MNKTKNSELVLEWLSMLRCVDVCAWKSVHRRYGNFPKLKSSYWKPYEISYV